MRRNALLAVLFPASLLLPRAASAETVLTRQAGTGWEINYDRGACHLVGTFGVPSDPVMLRFTRYAPQDDFTLSLTGNRLVPVRRWSNASLAFAPGGKVAKPAVFTVITGEVPTVVLGRQRIDGWAGSSGDSITQAQEAAIRSLRAEFVRMEPLRLETGSLAKPFVVLRACTSDLVKSWGYDPDEQTRLSRPVQPANEAGAWISESDYPKAALANREEALVHFRLDVDPTGEVAACSVLEAVGSSGFNDRTCQALLARARFKPALDAAGKAVKSYFVSSVRWRLPN